MQIRTEIDKAIRTGKDSDYFLPKAVRFMHDKEKDHEIPMRESLFNALKSSMGL